MLLGHKKSITTAAVGIFCPIFIFWKFDADPIQAWIPVSIITIISMAFCYLVFFVAEWLISKNILQPPNSPAQRKALIAFLFFSGLSIILLIYESYDRYDLELSRSFFAFAWLSIITLAMSFTPLLDWIDRKS